MSTLCSPLFSPLAADCTLGVVAFGSPLSPERESLGLAQMQALGYQVRMPLAASQYYGNYEHGFSNGSREQRIAAFHSLLEDDSVAAIVAARGGYGLMELLPLLDFEVINRANKPIIGLSDTTALLVQSSTQLRSPMIHGPSLGDAFADAATMEDAGRSVASLQALLHSRPWKFESGVHCLRKGKGEGRLVVANLSMLCSLLATPWDFSLDRAVLVLEDVGESPFRVHRNLAQLSYAGKFDTLAGLVFARFSKCEAAHGPDIKAVQEIILEDFLSRQSFPVVRGLEVGHWGENQALPLEVRAIVDNDVVQVG